MFRKNVASQYLYFAMVSATTGAATASVSVTAKRSIDGGSQGACTGTVNDKGNGQYELALSQADINGNDIGYFFTGTGMIPVSISVVTTAADPTDTVRFGLTALPNAAAAAANGLPILGTNAQAISFTSGMTISNASGDALALTSSGSNGNALNASANGTGAGIKATGGATGAGAKFIGGGTSGDGIDITTTAGDGLAITPTAGNAIVATANGTSKHGIIATGGTAGTSDGVKAVAGTGGVPIRGDITGNITGNLSGSAGSVTGAVGSVTGAVGSVTGNVGGNVVGSVASVTGAVGSVTGNLGGNVVGNVNGNVVGSVGSVVGAVGSVTGSVASVTGNVGGNVVGSVASVSGNVGGNVVGSVASVVGAVGSVTGNVGGNVTGSVGSVASGVSLTASGLDLVLMSDIAAVPGITAKLTDAINWMFVVARNKRTQDATTETVYKDDGSTTLATSTKSDSGSLFTRGEYS